MDILAASGIYEILNTVNGKRYVGSATRLRKRFAAHRRELRKGIHHSSKLQRAWHKYGEASFVFRPLLVCVPKDLIFYEDHCFAGYQPEYNICKTAGSSLGVKPSDETRAKLSATRLGKPKSEEHCAKLSVANLGKKRSPETCANIAAAGRGNQNALGKNLGNQTFLGKTHSQESCTKMSVAHVGKIHSQETRAKMSIAQVARRQRELVAYYEASQ